MAEWNIEGMIEWVRCVSIRNGPAVADKLKGLNDRLREAKEEIKVLKKAVNDITSEVQLCPSCICRIKDWCKEGVDFE